MPTSPKTAPAGAASKSLPAGVSQNMLGKALFFEDIAAEKLSAEARDIRWKENSKIYLQKSARMIKRLTNMANKEPSDAI